MLAFVIFHIVTLLWAELSFQPEWTLMIMRVYITLQLSALVYRIREQWLTIGENQTSLA